jgi:hypothetical protein
LISFVVNFWVIKLSGNPEQWGQTGDYFGGVLNQIFSGANLIVTILIARELHALSSEQGTRKSKLKKNSLKSQLQFDVIKSFNYSFNSMNESLFENIFENPPVYPFTASNTIFCSTTS